MLELTTRNLARLRELYKTLAVSQHDLEQGISDQQTAEGNLRAGRDSVRIFGKSDAEIDKIVANRMADPTLVVPSPINGRIVQRNAAPGLFVQPGNPPPPYIVADVDTMWMLANVIEIDSPAFRVGQQVKVKLSAFPDRVYDGKVTTIGATVDPNTRRVLVRSEINDPQHELRSGMFGKFVISIGAPVALPRRSACRRGARRRRHANSLGHRRPPSVYAAHGHDRGVARWLPTNSRRPASRRTGRQRGRGLPQQYGDYCGRQPMKTVELSSTPGESLRGGLC